MYTKWLFFAFFELKIKPLNFKIQFSCRHKLSLLKWHFETFLHEEVNAHFLISGIPYFLAWEAIYSKPQPLSSRLLTSQMINHSLFTFRCHTNDMTSWCKQLGLYSIITSYIHCYSLVGGECILDITHAYTQCINSCSTRCAWYC